MSEADICNLALGRLRVGQAIADIDDTGTTATLCRRFYDQCRQEVLRAFPWKFAQRATALALVADQEFPGWQFVYQYPSECLRVYAVMTQGGLRYCSQFLGARDMTGFDNLVKRMPFDIALKDDDASNIILSDVSSAWAFYTVDLENTGVFAADFKSALAWRIAMEVGGPIQADADMIGNAEMRYMAALSTAASASFNESQDDAAPDSPSISCRA